MATRDDSIRIAVDGGQIAGTLVTPDTGMPGVLFVHGWGGSQEQYLARAREVAALGCICLTFDLRGHADTQPQHDTVTRENNLHDVEEASPIIDRRRIDQLLELQDENNPTLASDIIQLFINDSPKHLQNIADALSAKSPDGLLSAAHRFLSSIENLGAQRMRKHCMALEHLGREGALDGAEALLDSLRREFDIARQHLLTIVQPD